MKAVLVVSGMERSGFPETLYLIQTINAIILILVHLTSWQIYQFRIILYYIAGNLTITAKDITISGKSINLGVLGKGDGGNMTFTSKNSINLTDNVHIYIDAYLGTGNGGEVNFTSKNIVLLDGAFIDGTTKNIAGNAGNINASGDVTIAGASQEGKG